MQYTIRNIPAHLDAALRDAARRQRRSLNEVAVEALARGLDDHQCRKRDLSDIAGSWEKDRFFANAIAAQDAVDPEKWQ